MKRLFTIALAIVLMFTFTCGDFMVLWAEGSDRPLAKIIDDEEKNIVKLNIQKSDLVNTDRKLDENIKKLGSISKNFRRDAKGAFNILMGRFFIDCITSITTDLADVGISLVEELTGLGDIYYIDDNDAVSDRFVKAKKAELLCNRLIDKLKDEKSKNAEKINGIDADVVSVREKIAKYKEDYRKATGEDYIKAYETVTVIDLEGAQKTIAVPESSRNDYSKKYQDSSDSKVNNPKPVVNTPDEAVHEYFQNEFIKTLQSYKAGVVTAYLSNPVQIWSNESKSRLLYESSMTPPEWNGTIEEYKNNTAYNGVYGNVFKYENGINKVLFEVYLGDGKGDTLSYKVWRANIIIDYNQIPLVSIEKKSGNFRRNDTVSLYANVFDADGDDYTVKWFACDQYEQNYIYLGSGQSFDWKIPVKSEYDSKNINPFDIIIAVAYDSKQGIGVCKEHVFVNDKIYSDIKNIKVNKEIFDVGQEGICSAEIYTNSPVDDIETNWEIYDKNTSSKDSTVKPAAAISNSAVYMGTVGSGHELRYKYYISTLFTATPYTQIKCTTDIKCEGISVGKTGLDYKVSISKKHELEAKALKIAALIKAGDSSLKDLAKVYPFLQKYYPGIYYDKLVNASSSARNYTDVLNKKAAPRMAWGENLTSNIYKKDMQALFTVLKPLVKELGVGGEADIEKALKDGTKTIKQRDYLYLNTARKYSSAILKIMEKYDIYIKARSELDDILDSISELSDYNFPKEAEYLAKGMTDNELKLPQNTILYNAYSSIKDTKKYIDEFDKCIKELQLTPSSTSNNKNDTSQNNKINDGKTKNDSNQSISDAKLKTLGFVINGQLRYINPPPYMENGELIVPVGFIADALGCSLEWRDEEKTMVITQKGAEAVDVPAGSGYGKVFLNGEDITSKAKVKLDSHTSLVSSARTLSDIFNASFKWDEKNNQIIINSK